MSPSLVSPAAPPPTAAAVGAPMASPPTGAPRSTLIDIVRALAISLVVLGHTNQGLIHRNWWGDSRFGLRLDAAIYAFHMPVFFFVTGIFLFPSLKKRGPRPFTLDKVRSILWPYLLWSCVAFSAVALFSRYTAQAPPTVRIFVVSVLTGVGGWFLPALFFVMMLATPLRFLPRPLLLVVAFLLAWLHPTTPLNFIDRGLELFPFLAAGAWMGRGFERLRALPLWSSALGAVLLAVAITAQTLRNPYLTFWTSLELGALGILMLLLIAACLEPTALAAPLVRVGGASLAVYVISAYCQVALRQLFVAAHLTEPWIQLLLPTLFGILLPTLLYWNSRRLHLGWLFVWPSAGIDSRPVRSSSARPAAQGVLVP